MSNPLDDPTPHTTVDERFQVQERESDGVWYCVKSADDIEAAADLAASHIVDRTIPYPIRIVKITTITTVTTEVTPL